jgi:hypothetical protein
MRLHWTVFAIPAETNNNFIYMWRQLYDLENDFNVENIFEMFRFKDFPYLLSYIYITDSLDNAKMMYKMLTKFNYQPENVYDINVTFTTESDPFYTRYNTSKYIEIENEQRQYNTEFEKLI